MSADFQQRADLLKRAVSGAMRAIARNRELPVTFGGAGPRLDGDSENYP